MKALKWFGGILALYVVFVVLFETVYLGWLQPSFEDQGIPMLVLTTVDESGGSEDRRLAWFKSEDHIYVSAHHWPRGWYKRATANPNVSAEIDGNVENYTAVVVEGAEFKRVTEQYPIPFAVNFLMGFPPERDILRLDPVTTDG